MRRMIRYFVLALACVVCGVLSCAALTFDINVSQVGFDPDDVKEFTILNPTSETFVVQTIDPSVQYHNVYTGRLVRVNGDIWKGDFSSVRTPADYRILCGGDMMNADVILPREYEGSSCYSFVIRTNHFDIAERFLFTFFTWQRCGSKKGWAGVCHQDLVTLYGTGRKIDVRGGYHQSGDLRGWADGISMSIYSLLRWSDVRHPLWNEGEIDEEIRWGCDYFLKLVGPEGYAYDCQFAPIGWGPRDYYPQPASMGAQQNICALLARAARRFAGDADYSRRLRETAERIWHDLETNPFYDKPYTPMVKDLPPGSQPANFYTQNCRDTAVAFAGRALAALELFKTTGKADYADFARAYGQKLLALQITDGPLSGAYLNRAGADELGFKDCSYTHRISGVHVPIDLYRAFGDEAYKTAFLRTCDLAVRMLDADPYGSVPSLLKNAPQLLKEGQDFKSVLSLLTVKPPYVDNVRKGTGTTTACLLQIMLNEAAQEFGRRDLVPYAARMRDWMYGANPGYACYVTGLGFNHRRRNVFGQFFPSTPSIPGGVCHVLNGEYDLPAGAMALWAIASESERRASEDGRVVSARSPDGLNEIRLYENPLSYEVRRRGKTVVERSRIGLEGTGRFDVELSAQNTGVAYRFVMKSEGETVISNEIAEVRFAPDTAYVLHKTEENSCFEENVASFYRDFGAVALATNEVAYLPLLAQGGDFVCAVTDAGVRDYPIWNLKKSCEEFRSVFARYPAKMLSVNWEPDAESDGRRLRKYKVLEEEPYLVKTQGPRTFPWRVFALADKATDLIGSTIVADLAGEQAPGDFSWVKPGKVAWDWWNAFDNKGDPSGCTTATYERFIDFAASNGVEYVILDEGWSERLNIWKFHSNVDVPHLIDYAAKRNVGIILWMAWAQIRGDEERVAAHFAKLGAKGFKVDFMDSGDALQERFLWTFAAACAKNRMLVDYHGVHRPTGLSKVYPNVLNWEGVHGLEQMKAYRGADILANDVAIVFTRMLAGPMDYTPGAMDNFPLGTYPIAEKDVDVLTLETWRNPGSLGTRARQMAMMVAYWAPLQMLCDSPTKYERERECFEFMAKTPVVWTDVVGLGGSPDTMAVLARKSRDGVWYAAGLTNAKARSFTLDTHFLGEGEWTAEIFRDAADSDLKPTHYVHERKTVTDGETIVVDMMSGGGFVVRFEK